MAKLSGTANVLIHAPAREVYQTLSDVTRMGEWSPECYHCRWIKGADGPALGAWFRGSNRRGAFKWSTSCRVTEVEADRVFAFEVVQPILGVQTRWRYHLNAVEGGTQLSESFEVLWLFPGITRFLFGGGTARQAELEKNVRQTLQRIKAVVEAAQGGV